MKKILFVFALCLMSAFAFAQGVTPLILTPTTDGHIVIDGVNVLAVNPWDPAEIQLEPKNGCQIAIPSADQSNTIKEYASDNIMNDIASIMTWQFWSSELCTLWGDNTTGYAVFKYNGSYGWATFDVAMPGGWTQFGYLKNTTGINENESHFAIYPNPATDFIVVEAEAANEAAVAVYDACGRQVKAATTGNDGKTVIDMTAQGSGLYFVKVGEKVSKVVKK